MNWVGNGNYALRSECGQYTITKASHTSGDWQYACFHRKEFIGSEWTAAGAKARCVDHSKGEK